MRLFHIGKDGGPKSTVTGYWLVEIKRLLSVALLRFGNGSRDEYHSHAFNSVSWVLDGGLREEHLDGRSVDYRPSLRPVLTPRATFHRVFSNGVTWVLTLRGPWSRRWEEYNPKTGSFYTLVDGRVVVEVR